jgi:hypothetical protein
MGDERTRRYRRTLAELDLQRKPYESEWKDLSRYLLYRRGLFDGDRPGRAASRRSESLDSRPAKSLRNFAAFMHAGLTSPARPWFKLTTQDPELMEFGPVRDWVFGVEQAMYHAYRKSNFYSTVHTGYLELIGFGVGCIFEEEDDESFIRFHPLTIGEYWIAQNHRGAVDTLYRRFSMTARAMAQKFGREKLSHAVKTALDRKDLTWFDVVHVVEPREQYDPRRMDRNNLPYASAYFEMNGTHELLWNGGYHEFPYLISRWETTGNEVWGAGPAHDVLPDIKQLTAVIRTQTTAIHKELDPPMALGSGMKDRLNLMPGTQHPGLLSSAGDIQAKPIYQVRPDLAAGVTLRQDIRQAIMEGFFNDLFLFLLQRPNMTATEVVERHEEKLLLLGPAIERQQYELFNPLTERTFGVLMRSESLPPPPEELQGQELKVEYISLLAQAQKVIGTQAVDSAVQFAASMASLWPEVLDKINADEALDVRSDLIGVRPGIIRTDAQTAAMRKDRAQKAQAAAADQSTMNMIQAGKTMSEIKTGEDRNALIDMLKNAAKG